MKNYASPIKIGFLVCLCLSLAFCSCNKIEKETEDIAIRNIDGVPVTQEEVTTMMEDYFSKIDVAIAEKLEDYRKGERQWFREYVENYVSDNIHIESSVDPGDIEQVYEEIGELQKQIHKIEDEVEKLYKLKKRTDSHDETIASILKQLDSITNDIDELRDAGVGPECQGLDDATDSTFDDIFKKLDEQDRKLKYLESVIKKMSNKKGKGKIKTTKDYRNMKTEELIQRLLWLLKNGSIDNDEQEICELVGELRGSGYITLGAWNLFKQTMEYYVYIEQEPHLEKSLESIYSILKEDKLFEMFGGK